MIDAIFDVLSLFWNKTTIFPKNYANNDKHFKIVCIMIIEKH